MNPFRAVWCQSQRSLGRVGGRGWGWGGGAGSRAKKTNHSHSHSHWLVIWSERLDWNLYHYSACVWSGGGAQGVGNKQTNKQKQQLPGWKCSCERREDWKGVRNRTPDSPSLPAYTPRGRQRLETEGGVAERSDSRLVAGEWVCVYEHEPSPVYYRAPRECETRGPVPLRLSLSAASPPSLSHHTLIHKNNTLTKNSVEKKKAFP